MGKSSRVSSRINGFGMSRPRPASKSIIPVNKVRAKRVGLKWTGNKSWRVNRKLLPKNVIFGCKQKEEASSRSRYDTYLATDSVLTPIITNTPTHTQAKSARAHTSWTTTNTIKLENELRNEMLRLKWFVFVFPVRSYAFPELAQEQFFYDRHPPPPPGHTTIAFHKRRK